MKETRIAQLSDLHITIKGESAYDVDVRQNFMNIYNALVSEQATYDYIVITGDICFREGQQEIYEWLKQYLDKLEKPCYIIPGNHDKKDVLKSVFTRQYFHIHDEIYYTVDFPLGKAFFLDTSEGVLSKAQLEWFQQQADSTTCKQCLIFMHHPPVYTGIQYMEEHFALENKKEFEQLLNSYDQKEFFVFCGHYHAEKTIKTRNVLTMIAPASFFQMDQESKDFKIDSYRIGWRNICWSDEYLHTTVRYVDRVC
ncbi:MAG: metallophosphoesterase [Bacteroidota bacterium]